MLKCQVPFSSKIVKFFLLQGQSRLFKIVRKWELNTTVKALKGLSHEIDFKNVDENGQILALLRAAAGF